MLARNSEEFEAEITLRTQALRQALDALYTEELEREKAKESLRRSPKMLAVGQLTGGIADDFNNMLPCLKESKKALFFVKSSQKLLIV